MSIKAKLRLGICSLFLLFAGWVGFKCAAADSVAKCKTIKIGMSYDEVVQIMGTPLNRIHIENSGSTDRLIFESPRFASTYNQCIINNQSGLVEEVICGESYKLRK